MSDSSKTDEFYKKLKTRLEKTASWPSEYLYKFILKTDANKIEKTESLFNDAGAVIKKTKSKNGKYTSISISLEMKNPN